MPSQEPILHPVPIKALHPTQMTVGLREVAAKRRQWREHGKDARAEFLGRHMIPAVMGPKNRYYPIDHHHLVRALYDEGVKSILVNVVADLRAVQKQSFWIFLDHNRWCHPYDASGKRRDFGSIPNSIGELHDDPFRSLAGEVRRAGGFAKESTPFVEFMWSDFFRRRLKRKAVESDFAAALARAVKLAKSRDADYMPGWCGPA